MLVFLNAFSNQLENCFLSCSPIMNVWQPEWPEWPDWPWLNNSVYCLYCDGVVCGVCEVSGIYYLLRRREERREHRRCQLLDCDWECDCHQLLQSLTDSQTDNTPPCVSPELPTKLTTRRLTGSWRKYLGATTPAQSSSTCC